LQNFGSIYENLKSVYYQNKQIISNNKINNQGEIDQLVEKILCGKYIFEQGEDLIILPDNRKINIINSSSGQQEILPLTIILSALLFLTSSGGGNTVYIEEPEAHLFPDAQKNIVELIATIFNSSRDQLQFFITTHSPYILTAMNNLLQAGILEQQLKSDSQQLKKLQTIIPKSQILLPEDVRAYSLNKGKCDSILSEETGLIDGHIIDGVSNDLAIKFDELLEFINPE
jgi:AAA15 family ATPase/GTPase